MPLRAFLQDHQRLVAAGAAVVLLAAVYGSMRALGTDSGPRPVPQVYFLDPAQGTFIAGADQPGPMQTPGGAAAFRAYVFTCGSCEDPAARFVGYLQKLDERALAESNRLPVEVRNEVLIAQGTLVAGYEKDQPLRWYPADTADARRLRGAPFEKCDGVRECRPDAPR